jgi:hypothetical protein
VKISQVATTGAAFDLVRRPRRRPLTGGGSRSAGQRARHEGEGDQLAAGEGLAGGGVPLVFVEGSPYGTRGFEGAGAVGFRSPSHRFVSAKRRRQNTHKRSVASDSEGRPLWVGAHPPGRMHDQAALKTEGIEDLPAQFPTSNCPWTPATDPWPSSTRGGSWSRRPRPAKPPARVSKCPSVRIRHLDNAPANHFDHGVDAIRMSFADLGFPGTPHPFVQPCAP